MKKSLCLLAVAVLLCSCGGDNGGGGSPDVSGLPEGTGAQLDVGTTNSAEKAEIANLVEQVIEGGGNAVESVSFSASVGQSLGKSTNNNMFEMLCSVGSYSKTYQDVTVKGHSSGEVAISGSISASKVSEDIVNLKTSMDGIFEDYSSYVYKNGKYVNLTGNISSDVEATNVSGLKPICDFLQYGTKITQTTNKTAQASKHIVGALSLSGGVGGALAFDITITQAGSADTIKVDGVATLKSGGATITCSVGRDSDPDTDIDNYKITCE